MDENKKRELNEEMSLDDLHETVGGTKGHCGFTDETGHCGFTCEDDGSYNNDVCCNRIHCPECWSTDVYVDFIDYRVGETGFASCNNCNNTWHPVCHM